MVLQSQYIINNDFVESNNCMFTNKSYDGKAQKCKYFLFRWGKMEQHIDYMIGHFGYFGIIIVLIGGIVGIPVPDEVLLTYVGYKVFQGTLSYIPSLLSAFVGAIGGISLSYFLGYKFGLPLI